ncbi:inhibitor of growth protein 1 isoform X2 [Lycorma delicatula]|uniref:inhibitor of growth protein 1 isoform X2 n=1 Tax=Lycorma delicatula TaxID=130591 RepID=UPI003F5164D6
MLNQAAVEALYSATYVENYLDCVENLPDDLQRQISRMRELDVSYQAFLKEVEQHQDALRKEDSNIRRRALLRVQSALISAQEVGDEKMQIVQNLQDLIENKSRQLDFDYRNLDFGKEQENNESTKEVQREGQSKDGDGTGGGSGGGVGDRTGNERGSDRGTAGTGAERQNKRPRRSRVDNDSTPIVEPPPSSEPVTPLPRATATPASKKTSATTKKKKRKARQTQHREETPPREDEIPIDPDEPTYCLCDQISYGEMICCDNDLCPIEWFHFSCVALTTKPKGKWYCPKCRGDRPNIMKPKAQFLKELERYNKEKEEKS